MESEDLLGGRFLKILRQDCCWGRNECNQASLLSQKLQIALNDVYIFYLADIIQNKFLPTYQLINQFLNYKGKIIQQITKYNQVNVRRFKLILYIIPNKTMQKIDNKKPLEFRTVHSFIPPTPNLQQIKRANMKTKTQKAPQHQIKIMTPRSTRNLHSQADKKKSFRNLSLVLDFQGDCGTHQGDLRSLGNREFRERQQISSNQLVFSDGVGNEGKENVLVGQFNMNMKKKSKQNINIEFKEVKSTKNKRFSEQIQAKQQMKQKNTTKPNNLQTKNIPQKTPVSKGSQNTACQSSGTPYANQFESSTYQNHYKASTLASFNQSLNEFSIYVLQADSQLQRDFASSQQHLTETIKQINEQYSLSSLKLAQMHRTTINQTTQRLMKLRAQHKSNLKQLQEIIKSITRYQADISMHYQDIVKQLDFSCFQDIMAKYDSKLEYFDQKVGSMFDKKFQQPYIFLMWSNFVKFMDKIQHDWSMDQNAVNRSERKKNFKGIKEVIGPDEQLLEQLSSRRGS